MYVKRDVEEEVKKLWELFPSVFVVGPRRSGKTTMAKKLAEEYDANYVSLDDPEVRKVFNEDVKEFSREYLGDVNVIDEIQYGEDPGRKLKYLIDLEGKRFLVTGSSARAVSKEVLSYLVGRAAVAYLYPFSLSEVLRARGERPTSLAWSRLSREYEKLGGFPEVVLSNSPKEILEMLTKLLISKEIPLLENMDATDLWLVAETISVSQSGPLNISSLSRTTGLSVYHLRKALNALEEAFIIKKIRPFFGKKTTKEIRKAPKVYFVDPGILNTLRGNHLVDGIAHETAVFTEILKAGLEPHYWRTKAGAEVDFVLKVGQRVLPVEAKLNWPEEKVPRGLLSFIETYKPETAIISDVEAGEWEKTVNGTVVKKIPIWKLRDEVRRWINDEKSTFK